ncbi:glycosyltransferase family 4 protein [Frateuria terrea]|uniref:Glycosyltransferase involved in cell wall bisynthesis n=1 Tax=Frateuria terrea TaxID=529704 RepID=A0A1H6YXH5_9GAMM|nr:glycosyltransferase family 4 protein [Frateuria terrea]SEJ45973.1 Glycosyltransferase involved in cell wall bisynthesis [Frateuria terrea]SFP76506.1 Glycosyltransferase involved in cell wall bisynthesis [Frateuria terrea]
MKFVFYANTDWYLYNFRLSTARRLQADGHEVVMLSPPGEFGDRFAGLGFRWITLPMDRASLNPLREAMTLRHLVRVLRREKPDLLHNFTVKCAVYGGAAARMARVPATVNAVAGMGYVFTSNDLKARSLRPVVRALMRATLDHRRSLLVLQNPDDADIFRRARLVARDRVHVIRSSGVDTRRFQPSSMSGRDGRLRVLLAARLLWEKGIGEYVEAARLLKAQGRDIEFVLAGSPDPGNPRSVDGEQVRRWAEEGAITWLGHVEDMPALLATIDVMALPSYYREGVPKSLIEGAAAGLALITTDQPGCREVVTRHGFDGLVVPPRSAEALATLIARLDDDRELLARLGAKAREKAIAEFDERSVIQRTLDVYERLLGTDAPRDSMQVRLPSA